MFREELGLVMFGKRVISNIPWSNMEEVTTDWRKLRSEELQHLHSSADSSGAVK
jgi:hypothetical protein